MDIGKVPLNPSLQPSKGTTFIEELSMTYNSLLTDGSPVFCIQTFDPVPCLCPMKWVPRF